MQIKLNTEFKNLNTLLTISESSGGGKAEVMEEVNGHADIGVGGAGRLQPDHLSLGRQVGGGGMIHKRERRGDGQGKNLAGLENRRLMYLKKAARKADIS